VKPFKAGQQTACGQGQAVGHLTLRGVTYVGWIDVALSGLFGVLLVVAPGLFAKAPAHARKVTRIRWLGCGLLAVAAIYLLAKLASGK
jgi:hypothetical protein